MENSGGEGYGDMHKIVLQGIMSAGFLDAKGVKNLFIGACASLKFNPEEVAERTSMQYVQQVVREINERIKPFDMAIRSASCELTGKKFYVFLVTVEKPIMKMQTLFSKFELELFQKIMNATLRKYRNYAVPLTECINMAREIDARNFSIVVAEEFIEKMITLQYLAKYIVEVKKQDYEITLGIRAIREFEPTLREVYDDVMTNCNLCKMIMLHGYQCPKCGLCIHKACLSKYMATCKTCPGCRTTWKERDMVKRVRQEGGEEMDLTPTGSNTTAGTRSASQKSHHGGPSDSGTATGNDMPILEPMVSPKAKRSGKTKTNAKGKGKSPAKSPVEGKKSRRRGAKPLSSSEEEETSD